MENVPLPECWNAFISYNGHENILIIYKWGVEIYNIEEYFFFRVI